MHISFIFLLSLSCTYIVQSAWVKHGTSARQRFHGWTTQKSTNPNLSGELLPQGIVNSQNVYRGGLLERPQWNGAPAAGFREASVIQSMYYAPASVAATNETGSDTKKEEGEEDEKQNTDPPLSQETTHEEEMATSHSDGIVLDETDEQSNVDEAFNRMDVLDETDEHSNVDEAFRPMEESTALETTEDIIAETRQLSKEDITLDENLDILESDKVPVEESTSAEFEDKENQIYTEYMPALSGEKREESAIHERPEQKVEAVEEPFVVPSTDSDTTEQTSAIPEEDTESDFESAADIVEESREAPLPIISDEVVTATVEDVSSKETDNLGETINTRNEENEKEYAVFQNENSCSLVESSTAIMEETSDDEGKSNESEIRNEEHEKEDAVIQNENSWSLVESSTAIMDETSDHEGKSNESENSSDQATGIKQEDAESELDTKRIEESPLETLETVVDEEETFGVENLTPDFEVISEGLDQVELTTHEEADSLHQNMELWDETHFTEERNMEDSNIIQSKEPRKVSKRIPLFQRTPPDDSTESAFSRVVRMFAEADARRRELIRKRKMRDSINGFEDFDALNDLFAKLSSVGVISSIKMYGKRITAEDGTPTVGKKRKFCIEFEWEMD